MGINLDPKKKKLTKSALCVIRDKTCEKFEADGAKKKTTRHVRELFDHVEDLVSTHVVKVSAAPASVMAPAGAAATDGV